MLRVLTLVIASIATLFICTSCAPSNPLPGTWNTADGNVIMTNTSTEISISAPKLAPMMDQLAPMMNQLSQGAIDSSGIDLSSMATKGINMYYRVKDSHSLELSFTPDFKVGTPELVEYKLENGKLSLTGGSIFSMPFYQSWIKAK